MSDERPNKPEDREARLAGEVAELDLDLDAAYCVALAAAPDGDDRHRPGLRADDPVGRDAAARLDGLDRTGPVAYWRNWFWRDIALS